MNQHNLLEKTIQGLGYELLEVKQDHAGVLRLIIDAESGVSIIDCEKVSNHLEYFLPVEGIEYQRLEVSSPGPERPLAKPTHFMRFINHKISVELKHPLEGVRKFTGELIKADEEAITIKLLDGDLEFNYEDIKATHLCKDLSKYLKREKQH